MRIAIPGIMTGKLCQPCMKPHEFSLRPRDHSRYFWSDGAILLHLIGPRTAHAPAKQVVESRYAARWNRNLRGAQALPKAAKHSHFQQPENSTSARGAYRGSTRAGVLLCQGVPAIQS